MVNIEAFVNRDFGGFLMDNLAKAMGETGTYTTMVGFLTNASHNEWMDGAVARQQEKYPNMKLLEANPRVESEDNRDTAYQRAKELFKMYPELGGIVGSASTDAPGSGRAAEELGIAGTIKIVGTGTPNENRSLHRERHRLGHRPVGSRGRRLRHVRDGRAVAARRDPPRRHGP